MAQYDPKAWLGTVLTAWCLASTWRTLCFTRTCRDQQHPAILVGSANCAVGNTFLQVLNHGCVQCHLRHRYPLYTSSGSCARNEGCMPSQQLSCPKSKNCWQAECLRVSAFDELDETVSDSPVEHKLKTLAFPACEPRCWEPTEICACK